MFINLKNCKVYIISPATGKYESRFYTILKRLIEVGFNRVEFFRSVKCDYIYDSLALTFVEIFKKELNNNEPFIIVEDDIEVWNMYETIEIPDTFSLLYLGVSKWAYPHILPTIYLENRPHILEHSFYTVQSFNNELVTVKAMTSAHAILYNCRNFMKEFIELFEEKGTRGIVGDLIYSALLWTNQDKYTAYALKTPMFFQDENIGGQESVTKILYNGYTYC